MCAPARRFLSLLCFLSLCPLALLAAPAPSHAAPGVSVTADAAILMDWRTGVVLYEKNAYRVRHPASLTKVLTAIVTLENCEIQDVVTVAPEAGRVPGSTVGLRSGQQFTVEDLLHCLLLASGNDAACALAIHVAGSIPAFAEMMNQKARQIGAINTHFANPHGLDAPDHLTTAYDQGLIARYALGIPFFGDTVATRVADVDRLDRDIVMRLSNTNALLSHFAGADGVKTGTTSGAGMSLIASATRQDHKLVAVVMHSDARWNDAARLLEYGFTNFALINPFKKGQVVRTVRVKGGELDRVALVAGADLAVIVPRSAVDRVVISEPAGSVTAPCMPGAPCQEVGIWLDGQKMASIGLFARQEVKRKTIFRLFYTRIVMPLVSLMLRSRLY